MEATDSQVPVPLEMTTEEAAASLGLSTRLSEGFLQAQAAQQQAEQAQMEGGEAQQEGQETSPEALQASQGDAKPEVEPSIDPEALKAELKEEIMKDVKKEMEGIRGAIADALNEE